MKKYRRTRKACALDNQDRLNGMTEKNPAGDARERFAQPAYDINPLSQQARKLIRSQGRQMEHKTVDEYVGGKASEDVRKD